MAGAVFALCALTSLACALLLLRAYRAERVSLLLWTCLCFAGLAVNNILLFVDVMLGLELAAERKLPALAGIVLLLHGFITNSR
jgi:Family of unknown function (DUF5985)